MDKIKDKLIHKLERIMLVLTLEELKMETTTLGEVQQQLQVEID
jgi:hypothetical protein